MKQKLIIYFGLLLCLISTSCKKEQSIPKVEEQSVEVSATQTVFKWTVFYPGKLGSLVEISKKEDMSDASRYGSEEETNNKVFTVTVGSLDLATNYYYRYLVVTSTGRFEMEVKSFTTKADMAKVNTVEVSEVTRVSAKVTGEVADECGSPVTERGVCWSKAQTPTTADSHNSEGQGEGRFSVTIGNLIAGETYYARAYAVNGEGTSYGKALSFTTGDAMKPTVTTAEVVDIDWRTAKAGGEVTNDWDSEVTERGVCWSTSHNPEVSGDHAVGGTGIGNYTLSMTGLIAGTTYYVRAYAKNMAGVGYGEEKSFKTKDPEVPVVTTVKLTVISGNTATGEGNVVSDGGADVTCRGVCWSKNPHPEFTDNHAEEGTGLGNFIVELTNLEDLAKYYFRAFAINSAGVGYGEEKEVVMPPLGAINSLFSVSATKKVYFSQGNLQYRASLKIWRFAEPQYKIVGRDNEEISANTSAWIDLFGWGTSGWNNGAACYQPWSTSTSEADYYVGNSPDNDLTGTYANADWGVYNAISNGGNQQGLWRTLTHEEWDYVFNQRQASKVNGRANARYALATVATRRGIILFPDNYTHPTEVPRPQSINDDGATGLQLNNYTETDWSMMEDAGAVFLPAGGTRYNTYISDAYFDCAYWSSTAYDQYFANAVYMFYEYGLNTGIHYSRNTGLSVRLVRDCSLCEFGITP